MKRNLFVGILVLIVVILAVTFGLTMAITADENQSRQVQQVAPTKEASVPLPRLDEVLVFGEMLVEDPPGPPSSNEYVNGDCAIGPLNENWVVFYTRSGGYWHVHGLNWTNPAAVPVLLVSLEGIDWQTEYMVMQSNLIVIGQGFGEETDFAGKVIVFQDGQLVFELSLPKVPRMQIIEGTDIYLYVYGEGNFLDWHHIYQGADGSWRAEAIEDEHYGNYYDLTTRYITPQRVGDRVRTAAPDCENWLN